MGEVTQNTNLASEYYVLSMLYRIGANAYLTLGNKKAVDIVIDKKDKTLTIDVKGLKGSTCFPIDNCDKKTKNHFLVFVSFLNKMENPNILPETYVVPSLDLDKRFKELGGNSLVYKNPGKTRKVVQLCKLRKLKHKFLDNWKNFI